MHERCMRMILMTNNLKIGMSMSSMRYYLWDHTGDRRLAVQAYLDLADSLGAYDEQSQSFCFAVLPYHNGGL